MTKSFVRTWAISVLVASALGAGAQTSVAVAGDPVKIQNGPVSGTKGPAGVKTYLGIPFAAPPVRENRWRAPQPAAHWDGVYTANRKPAECVQRLRNSDTNQYFGEETASEDCLYLNIWEPEAAKRGAHLPVVVYIYGGGFYIGSASMPLYSGEVIARKGVVYVAANYRVGVFGFMAHPEATAESTHHASGNYGLLDQLAALQWVQQNISAFGGDPNNVTLVGQSAGAMSINCLQASPLAKGLFQRIVAMSGAAVGAGIPPQASLAKAEGGGLQLQQAMKAPNLEALRKISADKIFAMAQTAGGAAGPVVDGYVLPELPDAMFAQGLQVDVPVITGSTADDIGTAIPLRSARTVQEFNTQMQQTFGKDAAAMSVIYHPRTDAEAMAAASQIAEGAGFAEGARSWALAQAKTGKQPAYLYLFTHVQPFLAGVKFSDMDAATAGAYHTSDVPYWLGTYNYFNILRPTREWAAWDRELSNDLQEAIVRFAKTGNPATSAVPFVRFDPVNEQRIELGGRISVQKINTAAADLIQKDIKMQTRSSAPAIEPGRPKPVD